MDYYLFHSVSSDNCDTTIDTIGGTDVRKA